MRKREELNRLVVCTLERRGPMRANELYNKIRRDNIEIMKIDSVKGFKSFVKIINQFNGIQKTKVCGIYKYYTFKLQNTGNNKS